MLSNIAPKPQKNLSRIHTIEQIQYYKFKLLQI